MISFREVWDTSHKIMDQHLGYGNQQSESPIELAKRLNTYKQRDRSRQYQDPNGPALLRSINHLWKHQRAFELKVNGAAWTATLSLIGWLASELLRHLK